MAIIEVKVPQLSESVAEATLLQWKKKPGEAVGQDEILIEIETDKVVLEVPAPSAGVLASVIKGDGSTVISGEAIATIDSTGKATVVTAAPPAAAAPAPAASAPAQAAAGGAKSDVAMPAASKLMADAGMSAGQVAGTGKDGRILKGDVLAAQAAPAAKAPSPAPAAPAARPALPQIEAPGTGIVANRPEQRVPMSRLRARVAERLVMSQSTAAILTTFNEVNMQPVMDMRNRYKDKFEKEHGVKLGFMSFFVKAAVAALKEFPGLNAEVRGDAIVYKHHYDLGIAVGTDRGLVVPVLRECDKLSFASIEGGIVELSTRAREGKLALEDLVGGTFTITNGGIYGSMMSTPLLNYPQTGILGMHNIVDRPMVVDGQIAVRPVMYIALTYDHRVVDGKEAVQFLVAVKQRVEAPDRLMFEV